MPDHCRSDADRFSTGENARIESDRARPADMDGIQDVFEEHRKAQGRAAGISEPEIQTATSVPCHEAEPDGKGIQTFCMSPVRQDRACAERAWPYYRNMQTVRQII